MTILQRLGRLLTILLVVGVGLLPLAAPAFAEEGGSDAKPADEKNEDLTSQKLENRLMEHDGARWALLLGKFVPILIGVGLLILWYLKRDKIKGGVLPPPPHVEPTYAFSIGEGTLWAAAGLLIGPALVLMVLAGGADIASVPVWQQIGAMAGCTIAVAVLVLLRRQRIQLTPPAELQAAFGPDTPIPTPPPGMGKAIGIGAWTYCVAGVVFVPAALVWALILQGMGTEPVTQGPVQDVVESTSNTVPILMLIFGTLVAPFTEECIFRGMLYPGLKRALGGRKNAAIWGAVIVSAIFAAVHANLYAAVPLFVLAMVLNWVFEKTNSLAACVIAHALHNGITMIPLLLLRFS